MVMAAKRPPGSRNQAAAGPSTKKTVLPLQVSVDRPAVHCYRWRCLEVSFG